ncbi:alpha/beta fold hydrolase [Thalassospira lucentensis]|uniref:alpha/beta fold hydrolase n=1 Tax=Thalassospira lucentensis TaxID=168935 RepID=UPI00399D7589
MRRDLIFIHSAGKQGGDDGSSRFLARLEAALDGQFRIVAPEMPTPERPDVELWLREIDRVVSNSKSDARPGAVLAGHSLGGSTILQYLGRNREIYRDDNWLLAAFSISAPFWGLKDWEVTDFSLSAPEISALQGLKDLYFCHSADDRIVPAEHQDAYADHFPHAGCIRLKSAGHLLSDGDADDLIEKIAAFA